MIELLRQAHQAARLPEQHDLLEALLMSDDRAVQRVLESEVCHSELLEDAFFQPAMGLALAHSDRATWRVLEGYRYSAQSLTSNSRDATPMTLGAWGAMWIEPERLAWLEENGLFAPWDKPKKDGVPPAEVGMTVGGEDQFAYWLAAWAKRQEDNPTPGPKLSPDVRRFFNALHQGSHAWKILHGSDMDDEAIAREIGQRCERVIQAWAKARWPDAAGPDEYWRLLLKNPPASPGDQDPEDPAMDVIVRGLAGLTAAPWRDWQGKEMASKAPIAFLCSLIRAGAPLELDFVQACAQRISKEGIPTPSVLLFELIRRCKSQPLLEAALLNSTVEGTASARRAWNVSEFESLAHALTGAGHDIFASNVLKQGVSLKDAAFSQRLGAWLMETNSPKAFEAWKAREEKDHPHVFESFVKSQQFIDQAFELIKKDLGKWLEVLLQSGLAPDALNSERQTLCFSVLRACVENGDIDTNAFEWTRLQHAAEKSGVALDPRFAGQPLADLWNRMVSEAGGINVAKRILETTDREDRLMQSLPEANDRPRLRL